MIKKSPINIKIIWQQMFSLSNQNTKELHIKIVAKLIANLTETY